LILTLAVAGSMGSGRLYPEDEREKPILASCSKFIGIGGQQPTNLGGSSWNPNVKPAQPSAPPSARVATADESKNAGPK
jgi:hypothetical protein